MDFVNLISVKNLVENIGLDTSYKDKRGMENNSTPTSLMALSLPDNDPPQLMGNDRE